MSPIFKDKLGNSRPARLSKEFESLSFDTNICDAKVVGYEYVYYNHDVTNRISGSIPKAMGYEYAGFFEGPSAARLESGLWLSYRKQRDPNLPPGILQGTPVEKFSKVISGNVATYSD
jgi:hypothetical protein